MGVEKVTIMVLKVDLQCHCCYKKVKKIICKFPQIRDQIYDEKANTVTITVVCCSPERIRDKLCYKGGKVIKSIEIKEAAKPKEAEKKKEAEKPKDPAEKPKQPAEKPKVVVIEKPKEPEKSKVVVIEKPKEGDQKPKEAAKPKEGDKPKQADKPKEADKPKPADKPKAAAPAPAPAPAPAQVVVPVQNHYMMGESIPVHGFPPGYYPMQPSFGPTYNMGYGSGVPSYHGYGVPPPPQPSYEGYYGYGNGQATVTHVGRGDYYFSDENATGCSIM